MIKKIRWGLCVAGTLLAFTGIITRLAYLQIYRAADYKARAARQGQNVLVNQHTRGSILDRDGRSLALDIQGGACYADPAQIEDPISTAKALAPHLHMPEAKVLNSLREPKRFVWLSRKLEPEAVRQIKALKLDGIRVVREMERFYPDESLACQLLGVVSHEREGLSGVEQLANEWLDGGKLPYLLKPWKFTKNAKLSEREQDYIPHSMVLTIDRPLQYIVEQELARQMELSKARGGTVVVQNPYTGEILAMASAPTFNANWWGSNLHPNDYGPETLKNPAVEKVVEPGSTFKIVAAAAALEENAVKATDVIFCEYGKWSLYGRTIHDHDRAGWLDITQVLAKSSNIGMAKLSQKLGRQVVYRYARAFGFGIPTGCGLPGDGAGILRHPKQWNGMSLLTIAFGQEVGVTPLQMVNAFSVIANGGYLREPRIYRGIVDEDGTYQQWKIPDPIRQVVSTKTAIQVKRMLAAVVDQGTGKAAQVEGVTVAGKTGTAQKIDPLTRQYSDKHYLASFIGFAPVEKPKVVIGVFLDDPQTSYWGGSEAAPVFARIIRNAREHLGLPEVPLGPLVQVGKKEAKQI